MSVTYGFYNSVNGDRRYDAVAVSKLFDGLITDGIFQSIGNKMIVKAGEGMTLEIGSGKAWFDHTWTINDTGYPITLDESEVLSPRIDAIVLEVNATTASRQNYFRVLKGTPATVNPQKPALTNTKDVHQHALAYVTVNAAVTSISQANIENVVGTAATPFITGIVKTVSVDELLGQWQTQLNDFIFAGNERVNNTISQNDSDFNTWFNSIKDKLGAADAARLQNEIDTLEGRVKTLNQMLSTEGAVVLTSSQYGDSLPTAGTKGRLFFKKYVEG